MPGWWSLQVPPEQPAQVAGDRPQRGVVEVGSPLGEVLHHQVPHGSVLDAVLADDLLDAAASVDAQRPQPQGCAGGQAAGVLEQCVEQRAARAAPEVVLLQGGRQLNAVPTVTSATRPPLRITIQVSLFSASERAQPIASRACCPMRSNPSGSMALTGLGQHQRVTLPHAATGRSAGSPARPPAAPGRWSARHAGAWADGSPPPAAVRPSSNPAASAPLAGHRSCQVSPG